MKVRGRRREEEGEGKREKEGKMRGRVCRK